MSHRVIRSGAIAAALTLTTVLAGCSAGGGGGDTPTGSGPIDPTACDGVTLSFIGLDGEQGDQELADWRKEHDMTLQTTSTTDMSQLIAAIKSGQQFDLATMTKDDAQRMIEGGIFQALPTDRLENWADMVPGMAENSNIRDTAGTVFGAPIAWGDGPFVYRPDKAEIVDDRLSILDLTKPEWKNRFVLFNSPGRSFYFIGNALGFDAPYYSPEELEEVAATAKTLVQNAAAFATNYQDATDRMVSGDVDLVINGWQAQVASAEEKGVTLDWGYFDEGRTGWWDAIAIPTTAQNAECAALYIDQMIGVDAQVQIAENLISGVVNTEAIDATAGGPADVYDYEAAVLDPNTEVFGPMIPQEDVPDGVTTYQDWLDAWEQITSGS
ncbi:MAG TPA: PotD/PotF family extracellular solute-binding protein [Pseudolysinimonas sp.]|nr:PotD/PotF family extracellular solute-binding protein [Pseudolysinimonas sp.]